MTAPGIKFRAHLAWASDTLRAAGVQPKLGVMLWLLTGGHNCVSWKMRRVLGRKIRQGKLPKPPAPTQDELAPYVERQERSRWSASVD